MSVTIAQHTQPSTWLQRLTGTEPRTVVRETSTTEISSVAGGSFSLRTALRNGGIGAAVAGALGGVSLLGKVALPLIGKVATLGGLAKLAGVGGALGIATAALPLVAPRIKESPAVKAALVGAGIGAAAGAVLPLLPIPIGAAIGAGVGLLVHHRRNNPEPSYSQYPGYRAYPGYGPMGTSRGDVGIPDGLVPVTPNYGMYGNTAMNPYAMGMPGYPAPGYAQPQGYAPQGYGQQGYGANPFAAAYGAQYGYGSLPATAQQLQQPAPTPTGDPVATKPAAKPALRTRAKTFTDKTGNLRQVGTGTIIKAAKPAVAAIGTVPAGTAAPVGAAGLGSAGFGRTVDPYAAMAGMGALPQAYAGLDAAMPSTGMSAAMPNATGIMPTAIPTRPTV